jgi:hypothetical protein
VVAARALVPFPPGGGRGPGHGRRVRWPDPPRAEAGPRSESDLPVGAASAQPPPEGSGPHGEVPGAQHDAGVWAEWQDFSAPDCASHWTMLVRAGAEVEVASAVLSVQGSTTRQVAMRPDGDGVWSALADGLAAESPVTWSVRVTEPDGTSHSGAASTVQRPECGHDEPHVPDSPDSPDPPGEREGEGEGTDADTTPTPQ